MEICLTVNMWTTYTVRCLWAAGTQS